VIGRLRDLLAPRRPVPAADTGYRRLLRWAALPVTDRRWAAPLAAVALGFGLFAGVAIGPGAAGTLATAPFQVIEVPGLGGGSDEGGDEGGGEAASVTAKPESSGGSGGQEESSAGFAPVVPLEEEPLEPSAEEEPRDPAPTPKKEEAPAPEAQLLTGTVVHVNPAASSYTVAEAGGAMSAVHAGKLPRAGTEVEVPIRALANGTMAEAGKRQRSGSQKRVTLVGIVTFVDPNPTAPAYTVSSRGSSLLVHVRPDPAGAVPPLPVFGAYASVAAEIEVPASPTESPPPTSDAASPTTTTSPAEVAPVPAGACIPDPAQPPLPPVQLKSILWQRQVSADGAPFTHGDFEGIVTAVCPATAQILLSADDVRASGEDVLVAVPPEIVANELVVGDSVIASADIGADGLLTLTGLASDERLPGADDAKATQGDLVAQQAQTSASVARPSRSLAQALPTR
jgi:hypothetical protein